MTTFTAQDTVGDIVTRTPALSRIFEKARIDYCCGGKRPLGEVCQEKGIDVEAILTELGVAASVESGPTLDLETVSLSDLVDNIVGMHHVYLRTEVPRLDALTAKVASVHGDKDERLLSVREKYTALADEISSHMVKEEQMLFPMIKELDGNDTNPEFHCGSISNPILQMESEHDDVGATLAALSDLTDNYTPPDWACNTYRAMLDGLNDLERDLHQHIHKENNVLFPRTLAQENELTQ